MMQVMEVCVAEFEEVLKKKQKEVLQKKRDKAQLAADYNNIYCPFLLDSMLQIDEALIPMEAHGIMHRDL